MDSTIFPAQLDELRRKAAAAQPRLKAPEPPKPPTLNVVDQIARDASERIRAARRASVHKFREMVFRIATGETLNEADRGALATATDELGLHPDAIAANVDLARRKLSSDSYLSVTDLNKLSENHQNAIVEVNKAEAALNRAKQSLFIAQGAVDQYVGVSQERTQCVHTSPLLFGTDGQLDTLFARRDQERAWSPVVRTPNFTVN